MYRCLFWRWRTHGFYHRHVSYSLPTDSTRSHFPLMHCWWERFYIAEWKCRNTTKILCCTYVISQWKSTLLSFITISMLCYLWLHQSSYCSWSRENGSPLGKRVAIFADDNYKCIFWNENYRVPIQISLQFVRRSPIDKKPTLVQVMTCRRTGDKPLPELMLT